MRDRFDASLYHCSPSPLSCASSCSSASRLHEDQVECTWQWVSRAARGICFYSGLSVIPQILQQRMHTFPFVHFRQQGHRKLSVHNLVTTNNLTGRSRCSIYGTDSLFRFSIVPNWYPGLRQTALSESRITEGYAM